MKCAHFQIQVRGGHQSIREILQLIDNQAPIPEPLEGGDGNGPLYLCVLQKRKTQEFFRLCADNTIAVMYTSEDDFELEDSLYRSDYFVHWQLGASPSVSAKKF